MYRCEKSSLKFHGTLDPTTTTIIEITSNMIKIILILFVITIV